MKHIVIAGGREFDDYSLLERKCNSIIKGKVEIISGGARGADSLAIRYAKENNHKLKVMNADWDKHGKSAGYIRNDEMLKVCDTVIAFWDGKSKGTKHMIDIATEAGKKVHVVRYDLLELHISKEWDKVIDQGTLRMRMAMDKACRKYDTILPARADILNAFRCVEFSEVHVVIVGQDPYPGKDKYGKYHAHGLSFSSMSEDIPASLKNVFKEIDEEYGIENISADLSPWTAQGVLLLNMVLTVAEGEPGSHKDTGWELITTDVIRKLSERDVPTVFMLWGRNAQAVEKYIKKSVYNLVLKAAHPSPMSADNGFFGCNHFIDCNYFLSTNDLYEIDWSTDGAMHTVPF